MTTIEEDLIMNNIPYPKYYNGYDWNTVIVSERKYIPKYLHSDLPSLRHTQIRQRFKEVGKFACPEISFFDTLISKKNKSKSYSSRSRTSEKKQIKMRQLKIVKQQLKYVLMTTDRKSQILVNLIEKANKIEKQLHINKKEANIKDVVLRAKKQQSLDLANKTSRCFSDTINLAFSVRKKQILEKFNSNQQNYDSTEIDNKINAIKMLPFKTKI